MRGDGVPNILQRTAVGATPAVVGPTTTQIDVKSLKLIRDEVASLLKGASPTEAHRLRKIVDDLNAGIPVLVTPPLANFIILITKQRM
jgi:hypothetical protein